MAESITGMRNAVIVQSKGVDPYAEVKKFSLENGSITSILQSDGEPAIKTLQQKVTESESNQVNLVKSRLSPTHVHKGQGSCESWHRILLAHLRLFRLQMSEQYG
eukprot:2017390-Amphidinium_carterae.1